MKINEMALRFFAIDLIQKIDKFDKYDGWEILRGSIDLLSDDSQMEIYNDIFQLVPSNSRDVIKRKHTRAGVDFYEEDEDESEEKENYDLEDFIVNIQDESGSRKRSKAVADMSVTRALNSMSNRAARKLIIEKIENNLNMTLTVTEDPVMKKLQELSTFFKLKESQLKFLNLVYHETINHKKTLGELVSSSSDITEIYTECTEIDARDWCSRSIENPLVLKGLMKFGQRNKTILTDMVLDYISKDTPPDLTDMFLKRDPLEITFPLETFKQSDSQKSNLLQILRTNEKVNILFSGLEGTGKTELARAITKELDLNCYFLKPYNEKGSDSLSERRMGLFAATSLLPNLPKSVLIVDEADKLLATKRSGGFFSMFMENVNDDEKAWTNQFLDQSTIKIIFITNRNSIDRSTLRRFNMMMEFDSLTSEQTASMVGRILKEKSLTSINRSEIVEFIEENPGLNIGSYALAADTALGSTDLETQKSVFFEVLSSHHSVLGQTGSKRTLAGDFDQSLLNLSMPVERILEAVKKIKEGKSHAKQLPMMFYGPPGTGKTELAHQIAKAHGMKLDIYGASDLLDPYVGRTEQKIAEAFKKSSADPKSILFIDEADSLFKSRVSAERSWMVSQTNEFLRQMENYKGIFIAATNFNTLMDEAAMRRFHIKLEFRPLTGEKLLSLYKLKFISLFGEVDEKVQKEILKINNLTPGDIHAVWSRLLYQDQLAHEEILTELKKELSFKMSQKAITL